MRLKEQKPKNIIKKPKLEKKNTYTHKKDHLFNLRKADKQKLEYLANVVSRCFAAYRTSENAL